MADSAPVNQRGFLATVRALLREILQPEFRPRWWEFAITFALAAIAYPVVTRLFWSGKSATFEAASYYVLIGGLPAAVVVLNMYWRSPSARAKAGLRALLQVAIMITLLVPLNIAGRMALDASTVQTLRSGHAVLREIRFFRKRHGRLPKSLAEIGRPDDDPLPAPTIGGEFDYEVKGDDFILQMELPTGKTFIYDSKRPRELRDGGARDRPPSDKIWRGLPKTGPGGRDEGS